MVLRHQTRALCSKAFLAAVFQRLQLLLAMALLTPEASKGFRGISLLSLCDQLCS